MGNKNSGAWSRLSLLAAVSWLVMAACGSDPAATSPTSTQSVASEPTTTATTTTATTIVPTTTTTVPEVVATGWSEVDSESVSEKAFPPCCADTWHGDASPVLAPAGAPMGDGPYFASVIWPDDPTLPLELELFRFEQCALLPEYSCEPPPPGSEFSPTQLGVDPFESRPETVALDDSVRVVVVGADEEGDRGFNVIEQGTGTDLAELANEVDQAYAEVFADRFAAGEKPSAIIADVLANPGGGFQPAATAFDGFVFTPQSGPPLLFQIVFPYVDGQSVAGRGTDVLAVRSIEVLDDQITLWVYAAYYS